MLHQAEYPTIEKSAYAEGDLAAQFRAISASLESMAKMLRNIHEVTQAQAMSFSRGNTATPEVAGDTTPRQQA